MTTARLPPPSTRANLVARQGPHVPGTPGHDRLGPGQPAEGDTKIALTNITGRFPVEVVIPLRWQAGHSSHASGSRSDDGRLPELAAYLERLVQLADVTVVDGSEPAEAGRHRAAITSRVRIIPPSGQGLNGKVLGALTGVYASRHELVVLADDDVRHDRVSLGQLLSALESADVVRPQNAFTAWPWHARWDTGRSLLARAVGADWPGTFAVRASAIRAMGGWDPDVLFENLEMVRTAKAAGYLVANRPDIVIGRVPPSSGQFWRQRLRQAYDDWAQPGRLAMELAILPSAVLLARRKPSVLAAASVAAVAVAGVGRRRFRALPTPPDVPLWAAIWLAERGVLVWVALLTRARGGVRYHGRRLPCAAHSTRTLRQHRPRQRLTTSLTTRRPNVLKPPVSITFRP